MRKFRILLGLLALTLTPGLVVWSEATPVTSLFVDEVYQDLLQRRAEDLGHGLFAAAIDLGGISRDAVALAVLGSPEYQSRLVDAYYDTLLRRSPDPAGGSAFAAALVGGMRDEAVIASILGSREYFLTRAGGTNEGFLDGLFADVLHRRIDDVGRTVFLQLLASGASRETVAAIVVNSVEARQAFVQRCYQNLLHRDADALGLQAFTAALLQGASNEAVIAGIVGSDEYLSRLGAGGRPSSFGPCAPIDVNPAADSVAAGVGVQAALVPSDLSDAAFTQDESLTHVGFSVTQDSAAVTGVETFAAQTVPWPSSIILLLVSGIAGLAAHEWIRCRRTPPA